MNFLLKPVSIGKWKIPFPVLLWFSLAAIAVLLEMSRGVESFNNYFLYRFVFIHVRNFQNLYVGTPLTEYDNHYGPFFSLIIAPFAFFPAYIGCFLWCIANAWFLYYAVQKLPFTSKEKNIVLLIGAIEMMTSIHNVQFNPMLTGWMILSFALVEEEKDLWATLYIAAGFLVKLYGIAGLTFFLFSRHKVKFILSFIFWMIVLICLPMIISSPAYIIQCYKDWYYCLVTKNTQNVVQSIGGGMQDISVMGLIRRIFKVANLSNATVIIPSVLLYALPVLRFKQYQYLPFRLLYLAVTLIGVVILSSSAESPTYVIAVMGVAVWYIAQPNPKQKWVIGLLAFVIVLTSLSVTDLFPFYIRANFIVAYSLKALPCFIVWLVGIYQLLTQRFSNNLPVAAQ